MYSDVLVIEKQKRKTMELFTEVEFAFVQRQRVGHLATSDEEGHPFVVPVCYACDVQRFYIALDEKPKSVEPRKL
jgi:coenzyme F420-0:L-glutamate ligase / coenzyme F420-1:gamma-L-glutamate ligase